MDTRPPRPPPMVLAEPFAIKGHVSRRDTAADTVATVTSYTRRRPNGSRSCSIRAIKAASRVAGGENQRPWRSPVSPDWIDTWLRAAAQDGHGAA
jgi:hypothetical protein